MTRAKHEPIAAPTDSACYYDGHHWRRNARDVCRWTPASNPRGGYWTPVSPWTLRRYPVASPLWMWLRSIGVERQASARTPEGQRKKRVLSVRVSDAAIEWLDSIVIAYQCSRGEALDRVILQTRIEVKS